MICNRRSILANRKAVGSDELPAELLRLLLENNAGLSKFHDTRRYLDRDLGAAKMEEFHHFSAT